jgi:hypothetical protein
MLISGFDRILAARVFNIFSSSPTSPGFTAVSSFSDAQPDAAIKRIISNKKATLVIKDCSKGKEMKLMELVLLHLIG